MEPKSDLPNKMENVEPISDLPNKIKNVTNKTEYEIEKLTKLGPMKLTSTTQPKIDKLDGWGELNFSEDEDTNQSQSIIGTMKANDDNHADSNETGWEDW
jgi:hypothetical protein